MFIKYLSDFITYGKYISGCGWRFIVMKCYEAGNLFFSSHVFLYNGFMDKCSDLKE